LNQKLNTERKSNLEWQNRAHHINDQLSRLNGDNIDNLSIEVLQQLCVEQQMAASKVQKALSVKVRQIREEKMCMICCENQKNIVFIPCYHVCVCERCSSEKDIKKCPVCDAQVMLFHKVFIV